MTKAPKSAPLSEERRKELTSDLGEALGDFNTAQQAYLIPASEESCRAARERMWDAQARITRIREALGHDIPHGDMPAPSVQYNHDSGARR